jgi:hypothetical protein
LILDHVQLAMPEGGEAEARTFFVELLGMEEERKPATLARRLLVSVPTPITSSSTTRA